MYMYLNFVLPKPTVNSFQPFYTKEASPSLSEVWLALPFVALRKGNVPKGLGLQGLCRLSQGRRSICPEPLVSFNNWVGCLLGNSASSLQGVSDFFSNVEWHMQFTLHRCQKGREEDEGRSNLSSFIRHQQTNLFFFFVSVFFFVFVCFKKIFPPSF